MNAKHTPGPWCWESELGVRPIPAEFEDIKFTRSGQVDRRIKPERQQAFAAWVTGGGETGNILRDASPRAHGKPDSATPSADSAESFCEDNTESMLIDAMRSTMAVAWGYLWHITTTDKRINGARNMLRDMIQASSLGPLEFQDIRRYGIQQAKADGCEVDSREFTWGQE